jgi:hypothetical protein
LVNLISCPICYAGQSLSLVNVSSRPPCFLPRAMTDHVHLSDAESPGVQGPALTNNCTPDALLFSWANRGRGLRMLHSTFQQCIPLPYIPSQSLLPHPGTHSAPSPFSLFTSTIRSIMFLCVHNPSHNDPFLINGLPLMLVRYGTVVVAVW